MSDPKVVIKVGKIELPIKQVTVLRPNPGDVLVFSVDRDLNTEGDYKAAQAMANEMCDLLDPIKVCVFFGGVEVTLIKEPSKVGKP